MPGCIVAALLGVGAAGLVACGNQNGLLSANSGSGLESQLDSVSTAVEKGDCNKAINASADLQESIARLPASVDPRLRRRLVEGSKTLATKAGSACRANAKTEPTTTQTIPTQTLTIPTQPTTATTPTQTQTTSTATAPTTATTPAPTPTAPSGGGGSGGSGGGGDSGSGGGASPIP